ncbi:hypothetical protein GBF38_019088, partial [Nibea albiflora]
SITALYGETITIPCNGGAAAPEDLMFIKWKYEKEDGTPGDLLIKQARSDQATVQATDDYAQRVSIDDKYNLLITEATLGDQKLFTCMVVSGANLMEYSVTVSVSKKPTSVEIIDKADVLQKDKPVTVCGWAGQSGGKEVRTSGGQLEDDGVLIFRITAQPPVFIARLCQPVVITPSLKMNPATGLSTISSTLQYVATKEDAGAVFTCTSKHELLTEDAKLQPLAVHYPSETVSLQIMSRKPIVEGDNVTLKCNADGNPPPSSYFFHLKGQKTLVENSDTYTLTSISREAAGEYKCTLPDNEKMEDTQNIVVSYLDLNLSLSGTVVKKVGDTLSVQTEQSGSADVKVSWMKDGKAVKEPPTKELSFADAGNYEESSYLNNKATHKITVIPRVNLTVTCIVSNKLGEDVRTINVSSDFAVVMSPSSHFQISTFTLVSSQSERSGHDLARIRPLEAFQEDIWLPLTSLNNEHGDKASASKHDAEVLQIYTQTCVFIEIY